MTLIVDSSVAIKWVLQEADTDRARLLFRRDDLAAPDFLLLECANVLTVKVRKGMISSNDAIDRLRFIERAVSRLIPMGPHLREAQRLSLALDHSAYDCLYLAVALAESAQVVTADARLATLIEQNFPVALQRL